MTNFLHCCIPGICSAYQNPPPDFTIFLFYNGQESIEKGPDILATEIIENLESALKNFKEVMTRINRMHMLQLSSNSYRTLPWA